MGLIAVVLLGAMLRFVALRWSLPDGHHPLATYHPDELINLGVARTADLPHGIFDIQFYNYGAFYFYLVNFAHTFARGWGLIPTTSPLAGATWADQAIHAAPEQVALFLTGRVVTALLGTATIPVIYALGKRLYDAHVGLLAALLYAIAPLAVIHAHFLTVDVPATFWVSLALLAAANVLNAPTRRNYVLAGVWVGLSAATKYNAGLVLIAPLAAHFLAQRTLKGDAPASPPATAQRSLNLLLLLAVSAIAFLIGCPGPLLNWQAFWNGLPGYPGSGVRYELFEHSRQGHGLLFVNTGSGWIYHAIVNLPASLGYAGTLLALAGVGYALARRRPADLVLLAFALLYYLTIGASQVRFARYLLPLFPILSVLSARLLCTPLPRRPMQRAVRALGAIAVALTLVYTGGLVRLMGLPDPRDRAFDWLEQNAPQGASVAFGTVPWFYSPPLSPRFGEPSAPGRARAAGEMTRYALRIPSGDWDSSVLTPAPDYVIASNLETLHPVYRLRQDAAVRWMEQVQQQNPDLLRFAPDAVFGGGSLTPAIVPEDLLYIEPTITIYRK